MVMKLGVPKKGGEFLDKLKVLSYLWVTNHILGII
jgi:hypothetical protein